jgi:hypothetical protein
MQREATAEWRRFADEYGYADLAQALATGFAKGGYEGALRAAIRGLEVYHRRGVDMSLMLTHFYGELGDTDGAFAYLEKLYENRDPDLQFLKVDPFLGGGTAVRSAF